MNEPLTKGVHHVGLAVPDLEKAQAFFCDVLGWNVVGGVPAYPAVFVSDGVTVLTLWLIPDAASAVAFNRRKNIGLHHMAFAVADHETLSTVYKRVASADAVEIEFEPEPMQAGAEANHFICSMPGGIRIEFATA